MGDFLLTFPFSSQPDFSLIYFLLLSLNTTLNQYCLKIEVGVVLTSLLVESWVCGKAVIKAGPGPSQVSGLKWGQWENVILHIVPFSLSSLNCCCKLERGSGNEKTHTQMHSPRLLPQPHPSLQLRRLKNKVSEVTELTTSEPFPSESCLGLSKTTGDLFLLRERCSPFNDVRCTYRKVFLPYNQDPTAANKAFCPQEERCLKLMVKLPLEN